MEKRDNINERRARNKAAFIQMLGHLGRKEFDAFEAFLAPDFVQEWPYLPLPTLPKVLHGARAMREVVERGMADFDPYAYTIERIYELTDPDTLIVEYSSHSFFHPRQVPYVNQYISVLRFRDGKVVHWIEYVNPLIIKEALLDDVAKTIDERFDANQQFRPGTPKR